MDASIQYPTWKDVGVPKSLYRYIKESNNYSLICYMAINRVFRFPIKAQYQYACSCGYKKLLTRVYEDYLTCEHCGHVGKMGVFPQWRMGKDRIQGLDGSFSGLVIKKMHENHVNYFGEHAPEGYFNSGWKLGEVIQSRELNQSGENEHFGVPPTFFAQFHSGERIEGPSQALVICQAAVLTPFLWNDLFDWRFYVTKDKTNETHLLPLINMIVRLRSPAPSSRRVPAMLGGPNLVEPLLHALNDNPDEQENG